MLLNARECRTLQSWWLETFRTNTAVYSVIENGTYVFKREALLQYYKDLIKATEIQRSMAKRVDTAQGPAEGRALIRRPRSRCPWSEFGPPPECLEIFRIDALHQSASAPKPSCHMGSRSIIFIAGCRSTEFAEEKAVISWALTSNNKSLSERFTPLRRTEHSGHLRL